ncbi:MAG: 30S ribosome-binding factor RbfA [Chloroflexota bacterium]
MSQRSRRVDHLLQEEISAIIGREVEDPRVGFVTITGVDVTRDLQHATVWVSIIGDDKQRAASMAALGRAMPFVRHHLGALRLRTIPELHLREDESAQRSARVMQLLDQIEADAEQGTGGVVIVPPDAPRALPTPTSLSDAGPASDDEPPLPAGYRRRVDRIAVRKARKRRGR